MSHTLGHLEAKTCTVSGAMTHVTSCGRHGRAQILICVSVMRRMSLPDAQCCAMLRSLGIDPTFA